ncbi:MAG: DUF2975 domain-containing protein [Clostridia bacterium]|nr:DUF2975 domain-containing protein [Clostridia bacterium]
MLKINRKLSVYISIVLTAVMFAGLIVLAVFMPFILEYLLKIPGLFGDVAVLSQYKRVIFYTAAYAELAIMMAGLGLLFALLMLVQRRKVFTAAAVELIRYISWCLIFMGIIMIALTSFSVIALIIGAAVLFLGLTVRVVKNVIEEAVYLKEENDLTV